MIELQHYNRELAAESVESFLRGGRLIQRRWRGRDLAGCELACLLGSIHPDIKDPEQCPAAVMPFWIAVMIPPLFDDLFPTEINSYSEGFVHILRYGDFSEAGRLRFVRGAISCIIQYASQHPIIVNDASWKEIEIITVSVLESIDMGTLSETKDRLCSTLDAILISDNIDQATKSDYALFYVLLVICSAIRDCIEYGDETVSDPLFNTLAYIRKSFPKEVSPRENPKDRRSLGAEIFDLLFKAILPLATTV